MNDKIYNEHRTISFGTKKIFSTDQTFMVLRHEVEEIEFIREIPRKCLYGVGFYPDEIIRIANDLFTDLRKYFEQKYEPILPTLLP